MAFSDEVVKEAWERASGQCECQRRTHRHFYVPCRRLVTWAKRGQVGQGGWDAGHINNYDGDVATNCLILCMECFEAMS